MITIIGNVNNAGFALPMVSAYPVDPNVAQVLGWNPLLQALDYVPFIVGNLGDIGVVRDLAVGRDAAITRNTTVGGTLGVTGVSTLTGGVSGGVGGILAVASNLAVTGSLSATTTSTLTGAVTSGTSVGTTVGGNNSLLDAVSLKFQGIKVVGPGIPGWVAATGTATRSTFVTSSVTLPILAEHVKALIDDLTAHGLIKT